MGAYLSEPITDKISSDSDNGEFFFGSSCMQGWRSNQEDAHNCKLDFDKDTSFFAIYDGHGGSEVALYCSKKLPDFLKQCEEYKKGNMEQALKDAFLGIDALLLEKEVIDELKEIANLTEACHSEEDDEVEELAKLREEGRMPLNEVLEKYKEGKGIPSKTGKTEKLDENASSSSTSIDNATAGTSSSSNSNVTTASVAACSSSSSGSSSCIRSEIPASSAATSTSICEPGPSNIKIKSSIDDDATVSSSSTKSDENNSKIKNEASSSNISIENEISGTEVNGRIEYIKPDSSICSSELTSEKPASSSSSINSNNTVNGETTSELVNKPSQENEISTNSIRTENVTSSSVTVSSENGVVSGSSANVTVTPEKISSTNEVIAKSPKKSPRMIPPPKVMITQDDDDDDDDDEENDGPYKDIDEDILSSEVSEDEESFNEDEDADMDNEDTDEEDTEDEEYEDDSFLAQEDKAFMGSIIEEPGKDSGCTAVVALLKDKDLYVANAGDSRCVLCRNGKAVEMSFDHKPEDDIEYQRITTAGGRVTNDGRVNGGLNLSRAIGDHAYKMNKVLQPEEQMISALPDVTKVTLTDEDEFMILACDGIWNFLSSETVIEFVRTRLHEGRDKLSQICEELFDYCLAPDTIGDGTGCDNMTAVIVLFKPKLKGIEKSVCRKRVASDSTENETVKRIKTDLVSSAVEEDGNEKKEEKEQSAS